jgi:hypothetical protein
MSQPKLKLKLKLKSRTNRFVTSKLPKNFITHDVITHTNDWSQAKTYGFNTEEDSMLHELMAVVDFSDKVELKHEKVKQNLRYFKTKISSSCSNSRVSSKEPTPKRGLSLPTKRTKEALIKKFNQEKRREPSVDVNQKKERKKSMIVITERFFNTKGSRPFISDKKLTNGIYKKVSELSTTDCKSAHRGCNPYEDLTHAKSHKQVSDSYLEHIDDMTPQKLDFTKSPQTLFSSSNGKVTPAKRSQSTLKIRIGASPVSTVTKCRTPKIIIPRRKLSSDKVSIKCIRKIFVW